MVFAGRGRIEVFGLLGRISETRIQNIRLVDLLNSHENVLDQAVGQFGILLGTLADLRPVFDLAGDRSVVNGTDECLASLTNLSETLTAVVINNPPSLSLLQYATTFSRCISGKRT